MSESEAEEPVLGNEGWADVLGKVLRSKTPKKKTLVLAKARKDGQKRKAPEPSIEIVDEQGKVKEQKTEKPEPEECLTKRQLREREEKRRKWEELCRVKPVGKEQHEQHLRKIATKGVIQLFTAVEKHQKDVQKRLSTVGESETKRDKVMKSLSKGAFLDLLKPKEDQKEETKAWSVLRDDFMLGASMKDWDKQDEEPT